MSNAEDRPARIQFQNPIRCPRCRQDGTETWEENSQINAHGPQSQFVNRSDGFYERIAKKAPYQIEVVCEKCGAVLRD